MIDRPAHVEWIQARVGTRPGHRLMVILAAPGCAYAQDTGGCSNCSFPGSLGVGRSVGTEEYLAQMEAATATIPADDSGPLQVDLFVSGSFFNPDEVPAEAQNALLMRAAAIPRTERILVETRPEYLEAAVLQTATQAVSGIDLEVAIGLESADPVIREQRINKGFTWAEFERAARLLAEARVALQVYLLLKPLETSEAEAIQDVLASARRVFALGTELHLPTRVALEPCFVAPDTPLAEAFQAGRYRPPWLWSVVEVLHAISDLGPVQVGLSDEGLHPERSAHNCENCSGEIRRRLAEFNQSQDLSILTDLSCSCRQQWTQQVSA